MTAGKVDVFDPNWLNGVTTIAPYAFRTCRSLTGTLQIPAHITSIGRQAFQNCSSLTGDLTVPNTVTDLDGYYTFAGMTSMTGKLTLESNITEIPGGMFNGSGFTSMEWQGKVTSVDNNAFTGYRWFAPVLTRIDVFLAFLLLIVMVLALIRKFQNKRQSPNTSSEV